jgi:hypothetical protein
MDDSATPTADPTAPVGAPRRRHARRRFEPRHAAYVVLLLVAAVAVYALVQQYSKDDPTTAGGAIERFLPTAESKILQQDQVGLDLAPGYEAEIMVNSTPLPSDEVLRVPELSQIFYQPGPGKAFEQWPAGRNCVVASIWRTATGPNQAFNRTWCFTVV